MIEETRQEHTHGLKMHALVFKMIATLSETFLYLVYY